MQQKITWKRYAMEFISIFVAVISAFALNNWSENRRDTEASVKILTEISNGLQQDSEDIITNVLVHNLGIKACKYWRKVLTNQHINTDSLHTYYVLLTKDVFSKQNRSGYETLKSKGLELITNDSLRFDIISLYEYDYASLKTLEENYFEMQFHKNYFHDFNRIMAPNFEFNNKGNIKTIHLPLKISEKERKILLTYLWNIQVNRKAVLRDYQVVYENIKDVKQKIEKEIQTIK